jgi:hypothetical protein
MLNQGKAQRELPRARFTPLKIKLLMKAKPKVRLNLLQESVSPVSRNLRLILDKRLDAADVLNGINSIDHVSLVDFTSFSFDS